MMNLGEKITTEEMQVVPAVFQWTLHTSRELWNEISLCIIGSYKWQFLRFKHYVNECRPLIIDELQENRIRILKNVCIVFFLNTVCKIWQKYLVFLSNISHIIEALKKLWPSWNSVNHPPLRRQMLPGAWGGHRKNKWFFNVPTLSKIQGFYFLRFL